MPALGGFLDRALLRSPDRTGRARAERAFPGRPCEVCGMPYGGRGRVQRHHRDGDRLNNAPENIGFLCVQHHKDAHRALDGRVGGGPRPRVAAFVANRARTKAATARGRRAEGWTVKAIAAEMGVHPTSVTRWLRKYDDPAPPPGETVIGWLE